MEVVYIIHDPRPYSFLPRSTSLFHQESRPNNEAKVNGENLSEDEEHRRVHIIKMFNQETLINGRRP